MKLGLNIGYSGAELKLPAEWSRAKAHLLWVLKRPEALDVPNTPEGIEVLGEMDGLAAGEKVVEALKVPSLRAAALAQGMGPGLGEQERQARMVEAQALRARGAAAGRMVTGLLLFALATMAVARYLPT